MTRTLRLSIVALVALAQAAILACGSSATDDHAVTAGDQNLEEVPCRAKEDVVCHAGEHTISSALCAPGLVRCEPDGCEIKSAFTCTDGYVVTTAGCRGGTARCMAPDAGRRD